MAYETLLLSREESFAVVTLNRPPANAISEGLIRELNAALNELRDDDAVRAVVLTGSGERIFCGGADLGSAFSGGDVEAFIRFGNSVMRKMERFPKPIIAAVNGHAMGGGCEIAMACHLRLLKEGARMGQTESNLGIIPGYGGTQRLPRLVGRGRALQLILSGAMISAQEAYRIGLVNEIVPATDLITRAEAILKKIASNAPIAVKFALEAANKGMDTSQGEGLLLEASYFGLCAATEDKKEGTTAFLEKRAPQFQGR